MENRRKKDIHHIEQSFRTALHKLENDNSLVKRNRELILVFIRDCRLGKTLKKRQKKIIKMVNSHPKNIIFLTCDASGVMPPIARLSPEQAQYHFISGYTSKIAGTEIGLGVEPKITFSACFGGPFMVKHPSEYAAMLKDRMLRHNAQCWLVNTGWVGGRFGVGKRISINHTRNLLNAALDGKLDKVEYRKDRLFGFEVPKTCPDVPEDVLDPSNSWGDKGEYWKKYDALAARFMENFKLFSEGCSREVRDAGPKRLSKAPSK